MCPLGLIVCYLSLRKKLGHNSDNDYLFPKVCAKYEKVLPTHDVKISIPQTPITYKTYEERFYKHYKQTTLKNVRVLSNYSSSFFRKEGSKELADKEMQSSLTQEIVQHNFWKGL